MLNSVHRIILLHCYSSAANISGCWFVGGFCGLVTLRVGETNVEIYFKLEVCATYTLVTRAFHLTFLLQLQASVRPGKGKDGMPSSSVQCSPGPATSSCSSRSIAIPSITQRHPIVPCHGSVEGFNQVMQLWQYVVYNKIWFYIVSVSFLKNKYTYSFFCNFSDFSYVVVVLLFCARCFWILFHPDILF